MGHKIILDCDIGIGGALALSYAMAQPDIDLIGICTSYGKVSAQNALRNAAYLCALAGRHIPVAQGAHVPLRKDAMAPDVDQEGEDGLGDTPDRQPLSYPPVNESGPRFIVEQARLAPGEVTVVTLGPLTTLSEAHRQEPRLHELLKHVVVLGGTITHMGNVSPVAESNIWHDPLAADQILTSGMPLTLIPLDVSESIVITTAQMRSIAGRQLHPLTELLAQATAKSAAYGAEQDDDLAEQEAFWAHEIAPVIYVLRPDWFTIQEGRVRVAVNGVAEGQTIMDRNEKRQFAQPGWEPHIPKIQVALQTQPDRVIAEFQRALKSTWI